MSTLPRRVGSILLTVPTAAVLALSLGGCSVDVQDGAGPRVAVPDVVGSVSRDGRPAARVSVELRDSLGSQVLESAKTDPDGRFSLYGIAAGSYEIKISGAAPGDFESVARPLRRVNAAFQQEAGRIDLFAFGAGPLAPADGDTLGIPSPVESLTFRWSAPGLVGWLARVQLYDASGAAIWFSQRVAADSIVWNGLGNQGEHDGALAAPGAYTWRVKFDLADGCEARTSRNALVLR